MRFRFFTLPALAVLILGALTLSCSKEQRLLDAIPSDVEQAGTIRLKSLFEQAGCSYKDGKIQIPEDIDAGERLSRVVGLIGRLDESGVCDPNQVAWTMTGKKNIYLTMLVDDKAKFKEITADDIDWTDETGDYACGKTGDMLVLLGDDRVWLTSGEPSSAVGDIESLLKSAKESSIASMTGIDQLLRGDNLINMVVRQSAIPASKGKKEAKGENPALTARWGTFTANIKDNKIVGTSTVMEADGKVIPFKGLTPVNPAVLAYVPESFNIAFAIGVTPEFDWSAVSQLIASVGGFQARGMLAAATPYLQALDGTVLLAAGPANEHAYEAPDNWHFLLMARLPQDKINDIMGMIRTSLFRAGVSPKEAKDGVMLIPQYGMDIYVGNVDGYLAVSNLPFDPNRQNSLAPLFTGKCGAISLQLPSLSQVGFGLPDFGVDFKAQVTPENGELTVGLTGTDRPILQAILETLL